MTSPNQTLFNGALRRYLRVCGIYCGFPCAHRMLWWLPHTHGHNNFSGCLGCCNGFSMPVEFALQYPWRCNDFRVCLECRTQLPWTVKRQDSFSEISGCLIDSCNKFSAILGRRDSETSSHCQWDSPTASHLNLASELLFASTCKWFVMFGSPWTGIPRI